MGAKTAKPLFAGSSPARVWQQRQYWAASILGHEPESLTREARMAGNLMTCPDCGKEHSKSAVACPQCGRPVAGNSPTPKPQTVVVRRETSGLAKGCLVVIIGIVVIAIVGQCATDDEDGAAKPSASAVTANQPLDAAPPAKAIDYTVVEQWALGKAIVISPANANVVDLRALGQQLKYETRGPSHMGVFVFSSSRAARIRRAVLQDQASAADAKLYDDHFVGMYTRNSTTGFHRMTITPKGINSDEQIEVDY